jgi:hypothetical protein
MQGRTRRRMASLLAGLVLVAAAAVGSAPSASAAGCTIEGGTLTARPLPVSGLYVAYEVDTRVGVLGCTGGDIQVVGNASLGTPATCNAVINIHQSSSECTSVPGVATISSFVTITAEIVATGIVTPTARTVSCSGTLGLSGFSCSF